MVITDCHYVDDEFGSLRTDVRELCRQVVCQDGVLYPGHAAG